MALFTTKWRVSSPLKCWKGSPKKSAQSGILGEMSITGSWGTSFSTLQAKCLVNQEKYIFDSSKMLIFAVIIFLCPYLVALIK